MAVGGFQLVFFFNAVFLLVMGAGTQNRHLTFFANQPVTWNHAVEICEAIDSQLIAFDSEDVFNAVKEFANGIWKLTWSDFWTGLHNVGNTEPVFLWQGLCTEQGSYQPWDEITVPELYRCVEGDDQLEPGKILENQDCFKISAKALCERKEGSCRFRRYEECGVLPGPFTAIVLQEPKTKDDCQQACLNYSGEQECWAVKFKAESVHNRSCYLYLDTSSTAMAGRVQSEGTDSKDTYLKSCFSAAINTTSLGRKYYSENRDPWKGCSVEKESHTVVTVTEESTSSHYATSSSQTTTGPSFSTTATSTQPTNSNNSTVTPVTNATTSTTIPWMGSSGLSTNATSESVTQPPAETTTGVLTPTPAKSSSTSRPATSHEPQTSDVTPPTSRQGWEGSTPQSGTRSTTRFSSYFEHELASPAPSSVKETVEPLTPYSSSDLATSYTDRESTPLSAQATTGLSLSSYADDATLETPMQQITVTEYVTLTTHYVPILATSPASLPFSSPASNVVASSHINTELTSQDELQSTATSAIMSHSAFYSPEQANVTTVTFKATSTLDVPEMDVTSDIPLLYRCPEPITSVSNGTCCACQADSYLTQQEKRDIMTQILAGLSLNKTQVSANQRRYLSASDSRKSVAIMGYLGVALMALVFLSIFLVDIKYIARDMKYFIFVDERGQKCQRK